jgi:hypothetical protein
MSGHVLSTAEYFPFAKIQNTSITVPSFPLQITLHRLHQTRPQLPNPSSQMMTTHWRL